MLYEVLGRIIARGNTEGLREKIDVFFAADRLTNEQYQALCALL